MNRIDEPDSVDSDRSLPRRLALAGRTLAGCARTLRGAMRAADRDVSRGRSVGLLLICALLLSLQQAANRTWRPPGSALRPFAIQNATGLRAPEVYAYGLYYWGLFPVYSTYERGYKGSDKYSPEFARQILLEHGDTLHVEYRHEMRFGEHVKFMLPYLEAFISRTPGVVGVTVVNTAFYLASLLLLLFAFCKIDRPFLGAFILLVLASSPFQAAEILRNENFCYVIIAATLVLALLVPFLADRRLSPLAIGTRLVLLSAACVAFGNIRTTAFVVAMMPCFALLLYTGLRIRSRLVSMAAFVVLLLLLNAGLHRFFDYKIEQANAFVESLGGQPYRSARTGLHPLWHSVWCGLADFDTVYGFRWADGAARRAAGPELVEAGILTRDQIAGTGGYYDAGDGGPYSRVETSAVYARILKGQVLRRIKEDPKWFGDILAKRMKRIFGDWVPPELDLVFTRIPLWPNVWSCVMFVVLLMALGMWFELKLTVVTLPTIATALLVTTKTHAHYYLIAHLICAGILVASLAGIAVHAARMARGFSRHVHQQQRPLDSLATSEQLDRRRTRYMHRA